MTAEELELYVKQIDSRTQALVLILADMRKHWDEKPLNDLISELRQQRQDVHVNRRSKIALIERLKKENLDLKAQIKSIRENSKLVSALRELVTLSRENNEALTELLDKRMEKSVQEFTEGPHTKGKR